MTLDDIRTWNQELVSILCQLNEEHRIDLDWISKHGKTGAVRLYKDTYSERMVCSLCNHFQAIAMAEPMSLDEGAPFDDKPLMEHFQNSAGHRNVRQYLFMLACCTS